MIADLTTPLRDAAYLAFEDGTNDYTTAPKAAYVLEAQAARIAELEAALATARREGMEEAAKKALIIASVLSDPSAQNALRSFAGAIRAELEGEKE